MATSKAKTGIARNLTENCPDSGSEKPAAESLVWAGRRIPLLKDGGLWRARKRSKWLAVDIATGTPNLADAKRIIREELEKRAKNPSANVSKETLEDVVRIYAAAPKRIAKANGEANVQRLRAVVRIAWGKTLDRVKISELPKLWPAYVAKRQRKELPDYNTRLPENRGINSAMRLARSIFIAQLAPAYAEAGIVIPPGASAVTWLPESYVSPAEVGDAEMIDAWRQLDKGPLWWAIGLARFAGLRRSEILAMRGKWVSLTSSGGVKIELRDRPEDKYWTKTGRPYSAMVLDPELATALREVEKDAMVIVAADAEVWIEREPQKWLRQFVGASRLPLHRLRGLYADQVKRETEAAILARQQGIKAASEALGHTSTKTTTDHYLDPSDD